MARSRWLHADGNLRPTDLDSTMKRPQLILGGGGAALLGGVSALHLYWAAGGRRGQHAVVPTSDGRALDSTLEDGDGRRRRGVGDGRRALRRRDGTMGAALGVPRWGGRRGDRACRPGDRRPTLRRFHEAVPRLSVRPARHVPLLAVVRRSRRRRRSRLRLSRRGSSSGSMRTRAVSVNLSVAPASRRSGIPAPPCLAARSGTPFGTRHSEQIADSGALAREMPCPWLRKGSTRLTSGLEDDRRRRVEAACARTSSPR